MTAPKVSVLMPAYNCGQYIHQAISSILDQTYSNIELVICDDGSTDSTWQVITSFNDDRIRAFRHSVNKGYLATYNFLMTLVNGNYFTFQDADDWSATDRIELQLSVLENRPDIMVCTCNGTFYYNEKIQRKCPPFQSGNIEMKEGNFEFMLPAVMYRTEILKKFNKFHHFFDGTTGGDQYFIMEVLSHFKGYKLNAYLYTARFNPSSNHRTVGSKRKLAASEIYYELKRQRVKSGTDWIKEARFDLLEEFESSLLNDRKFLSEKYREYAVYRIDANQLLPGLHLLVTSWYYWPMNRVIYRTLFYAIRKLFVKV